MSGHSEQQAPKPKANLGRWLLLLRWRGGEPGQRSASDARIADDEWGGKTAADVRF